MANTYVITPLHGDERLAQYRSVDLPSNEELIEKFGPVAIYDLTDNMKPLGYVHVNNEGWAEFREFYYYE